MAEQTISEMAFARSQTKAGELANLGMTRGMSAVDVLLIWAGIVAHADPRMARLSLEAMEDAINATPDPMRKKTKLRANG